MFSLSRRISIPFPLQWGAPTFSANHAFGMMAAVVVSLIEVLEILSKYMVYQSIFQCSENISILQTTGAFMAAARLASATPPPAYVLSRGIGWQVSGLLIG